MSASPGRRAAFAVLRAVYNASAPDTPLPALIDRQNSALRLDARDTAFATELACGVLRHEARLRFLLEPYVARPQALPPDLLILLWMGAYELLFLRVPAHATIHQYAGLAAKFGKLRGLANAVLRAVDRDAAALRQRDASSALPPSALATPDADAIAAVAAIARTASVPPAVAKTWVATYGAEKAHALALSSSVAPAPAWRVNLRRGDEARTALAALGLRDAHGELTLPNPPAAEILSALAPLEAAGLISRQGLASQRVAARFAALAAEHGLDAAPLWDACCGRGGKTCALLERGLDVRLASDPSAFRLEALRADIARLGLPAPDIRAAALADMAAELEAEGRRFPLILLDAPCGGTGTLGRVPELRPRLARLTAERRDDLIALQGALTADAWRVLEPGGLLAYATCSLMPEENEERASAFLTAHPDAQCLESRLWEPPLPGQDILFMAVFCKRP